MKHNPRLNERIARYPGFALAHPMQPDSTVQGTLKVMFELQNWLAELTGLPGVCLTPAAGAHGVLIPQRRSCQLSAAVAKASAGAIEYVKVAQIGNVAQTLTELKKQGFWVIGTDPAEGSSYYDVDLTGPVVIVIGDEGEGMARLTRERCDSLVQIPMHGKVQSLNASVASAILLYEMLRQRQGAGLLP